MLLPGVILPALRRFRPDFIIVQAGYDAHIQDPLADLSFSTASYYTIARALRDLAEELGGVGVVYVLEGGYEPQALALSVGESFRALVGLPATEAGVVPVHADPNRYGFQIGYDRVDRAAVERLVAETRTRHGL